MGDMHKYVCPIQACRHLTLKIFIQEHRQSAREPHIAKFGKGLVNKYFCISRVSFADGLKAFGEFSKKLFYTQNKQGSCEETDRMPSKEIKEWLSEFKVYYQYLRCILLCATC